MTQIAVFVVLVFAIPWIVSPWLPQEPQTRWEIIATYVPGVWAPTVVAIAMMTWTGGLTGLGRELKRLLTIRPGSGRWLLVAAVTPAAVSSIGILAARLTGDAQPFLPSSAAWNVVMNALLTGAVGEELGWRGFLLSRLDERISPATASVVMAALWTLWHVPIFLFPDSPYATWPMVPALLTIVLFGAFMGAMYHLANGSILPTILAHLLLNVLLSVGGAPLSSPVLWWTLAAVYLALSWTLLRAVRRGTMGRVADKSLKLL